MLIGMFLMHEPWANLTMWALSTPVVLLFGRQFFVNAWKHRLLNIHPSLLPKFPGTNTHARALEAGESEHGCTVHLVVEEVDSGQILGQARMPILASDMPETLAERVLALEHELYPRCLAEFARGLS